VLQGLRAAGIIPTANNPAPAVPSAINTAVQQEIVNITEGDSTISARPPGKPFSSVAITLESRVSDKIKNKIWRDEYVDLGALLSSTTEDPKYAVSVSNDSEPGTTRLCLEPINKAKRISTIGQWSTAISTFIAVYTIKFPASTSALMKYCEIVRDLANRSANWRWYDEQFRYLRQSNSSDYPWEQVQWELWFQSLPVSQATPKAAQAFSKGKGPSSSSPFQKGYCWKYNGGGFCSGCKFKHACSKCSGSHPGSECHTPSRANNQRGSTDRPVRRDPNASPVTLQTSNAGKVKST